MTALLRCIPVVFPPSQIPLKRSRCCSCCAGGKVDEARMGPRPSCRMCDSASRPAAVHPSTPRLAWLFPAPAGQLAECPSSHSNRLDSTFRRSGALRVAVNWHCSVMTRDPPSRYCSTNASSADPLRLIAIRLASSWERWLRLRSRTCSPMRKSASHAVSQPDQAAGHSCPVPRRHGSTTNSRQVTSSDQRRVEESN